MYQSCIVVTKKSISITIPNAVADAIDAIPAPQKPTCKLQYEYKIKTALARVHADICTKVVLYGTLRS